MVPLRMVDDDALVLVDAVLEDDVIVLVLLAVAADVLSEDLCGGIDRLL